MSRQTTKTRKAKKEKASAEEFIAAANEAIANGTATTKPKRIKRTKGSWPCTAEDVVRERDQRGLSWRQVAANLGLGSPGQARTAYTELTGKPHYESQPIVKRAPKGTVGKVVDSPGWDDDSDQEEIEARLNGSWIEASGEGQNYTPAHWSGSFIVVRHKQGDYVWDEDCEVSYVTAFTFGPEGDQPLQVLLHEKGTSAFRAFRVADILEVR